MPKPPLPPELEEFLEQPNPAVIATLQPDGGPHTAATWYLWEDGRVLVNMEDSRRRLEYLRSDPRVSLTVLGADDWYHHVTLRGRAVAIEDDADFSGINRLSRHYTGEAYSRRERGRVNAWIEVEWWHSWAVGEPWR
ncbi:MAG: TIGR03618 family F420-dependent PPOX class oxidoreductase [Thermoleophilaceae bacterium]